MDEKSIKELVKEHKKREEEMSRVCYIKCSTCGRLLGTYIHYGPYLDLVIPGIIEEDACNMQAKSTSSIMINGKIRKIYCTDQPCKPNMLSEISIEGDGQ